ncbi:MAG TPA: DUF1592 domain-containing protein [Verrucomicrobiae bacterium]|nr:DUF1592 domain-containing protein [Verrucomicrobiae bacterium]
MFRRWPLMLFAGLTCSAATAAELPGAADFHRDIQPILETYCYDCHGDGKSKADVAFDQFDSDQSLLQSRGLWWKALKNVRAGIMPPAKEAHPTLTEQERLASWIKKDVFNIDPENPDPGRVTVRRLNRVEYRNTIRDLMGVDYDTTSEFPPDDSGNGFDNIGDVLTLSPMLLEKYVNAAQAIVAQAVPTVPKVVVERAIAGASFHKSDPATNSDSASGPLSLSYYEAASASNTFQIEHPGKYQLVLNLTAAEKYVDNQFDYNKCRLVFTVDGREVFTNDYNREGNKLFHYEVDEQWPSGEHTMSLQIRPLTPGEDQVRSLAIRLNLVTLRGPFDEKYEVPPKNYARYFPKPVPLQAAARRAYAHEILGEFAFKAFRRPVDPEMLGRLTALAEKNYSQPDQTFEAGVAQAMVAVLASPGFLFREEGVEPAPKGGGNPLIDEYALASRLSYFLWSSMPDDELFQQAAAGTLRRNLQPEVSRMLADARSSALAQNFAGQWLETRDIATVPIDARAVLSREAAPPAASAPAVSPATNAPTPQTSVTLADAGTTATPAATPPAQAGAVGSVPGRGGRGFRRGFGRRGPRVDLDDALRKDMQSEVEMYFSHIVHDDRNVVELVDSDYTFLNERLAKHYALTNLNITGADLRLVTLPTNCPRGGVLTMGSVLAVTSNPTRTSPVKRGLFILDNILGTPSPPPPPNIPPLEDSESAFSNHPPVLREVLELHRSQPICASCHDRLDPPGLALENFNAMGMWRDKERGQTIEVGGQLATGEKFANVQELKHILANQHRTDFYRCLAEKLLTYAVGRNLENYDVESVDRIVERMQKQDGHFSALLMGVIESAPFQKRRASSGLADATPSESGPHHMAAN